MADKFLEDDVIKCIVNTKDGKLTTLEELTPLGNRLFCIFMHLLVKDHGKKTSDLFSWLQQFKHFKLSGASFYRIVSHYKKTNCITEQSEPNKMIQIRNTPIPQKGTRSNIFRPANDGINEKISSNCGAHSQVEMSNSLGLSRPCIGDRIKKHNLKFSNKVHGCYFCKLPSEVNKKPTEKDKFMEKLKSVCAHHSIKQMAQLFGVKRTTLSYQINRLEINFENNSVNDCYLCKSKPGKTEIPVGTENCDSLRDSSLSESKVPISEPDDILIKTENCDSFSDNSVSQDNSSYNQSVSPPEEEISIKTENSDSLSENLLSDAKFLDNQQFSQTEEEIAIKDENIDSLMDTSFSDTKFSEDPLKI